jgi:predicted porin
LIKKQLLLLSALGLAQAAWAQSSVTLFGVADATLSRGTGSVSDRTQMLRGGLTSNRLGFRGVEDLGGGLSANFWLEFGFNIDDGSGQPTNTNNQASGAGAAGGGFTFARRSTVGLAGKSWGEVRLGRDFVPQYDNLVRGDVFGNVGVGSSVNFTNIITGVVSTRASNMIEYFTPSFGGFGAHVAHYLGENPDGAANEDDGTGQGVRLYYAAGPLAASVAYGRTDNLAGDIKQRNINLGYNFGVARVTGTWGWDRAGAVSARGGSLGVIVPVGVHELKAGYSVYRTSAAAKPEARKLALGYVHNLSKRTALYATLAHVRNSGGSTTALNGATTGANQSSSGLDLGVRHAF